MFPILRENVNEFQKENEKPKFNLLLYNESDTEMESQRSNWFRLFHKLPNSYDLRPAFFFD